GSETLEGNQAPPDIVGALMGQEIADQGATMSRDDPGPIFRIGTERVPLGGVDLITNEAGDARHGLSPESVERAGREGEHAESHDGARVHLAAVQSVSGASGQPHGAIGYSPEAQNGSIAVEP